MRNSDDGDRDVLLMQRLQKVSEAFSPSAPVARQDLFRGRTDQMMDLMDSVNGRGQHAVIYGERGVGKTSLARTVEIIVGYRQSTFYVTCDSSDTFESIWRKAAEEINIRAELAEDEVETAALETGGLRLFDSVSPNDIRLAFMTMTRDQASTVFVDEFDRVSDAETKRLFADLIKILSDNVLPMTLVLIGVADSVTDLIEAHESTARSVIEIPMPRMSRDEIKSILDNGFNHVGINADSTLVARLVSLALGLPHFAHLLGQCAATAAVRSHDESIEMSHFDATIDCALSKSSESLKASYLASTTSNRPGTLYKDVLTACALAPQDDAGTFAPADVRSPLSRIAGRPYEITSFNRHLGEFSSKETNRGGILDRLGQERRYRYRFADPLMQPYVVLRAVREGLISSTELGLIDESGQQTLPLDEAE